VSLAGRLEHIELAEILHFLALNSRTGKITLTRRDAHGLIVVRLGRVIYAASSSIRETLGNMLVCRGLVTPQALAAALESQHLSAGGQKLGGLLVAGGSLTEAQLQDVLRQQIGFVIQELCRWRSGYFKFEVMPVASSGEIGVDAEDLVVAGGVATDQILLEAMARLDEGAGREGTGPSTPRAIASAPLSPALRGEVTLGLLRRASRSMRRGLLLVLRGDEVQGAGQFGFDGHTGADEIARRIRVPLAEASIVSEVIDRREAWRGKIPETPGNERFLALLGGPRPKEALLVPMLLHEGAGLVFYGDNAPEDRPLGSLEDLEWALLEAGLAMQRDLLEQRLRDFERARGYRP
jgi:hypothetical protein